MGIITNYLEFQFFSHSEFLRIITIASLELMVKLSLTLKTLVTKVMHYEIFVKAPEEILPNLECSLKKWRLEQSFYKVFFLKLFLKTKKTKLKYRTRQILLLIFLKNNIFT